MPSSVQRSSAPSPSRPVAIVTGADHPTGLGSGRALRAAGARVLGVTGLPGSPCAQSRVWDSLHVTNPGGDRLEPLLSIARTLDAPTFLLPTQDDMVSEVSARRKELEGSYRFVLPPDSVVQTFMEKTRFYEWARPLGLPLPITRAVRTRDELHAALAGMPYPLIVKPLFRTAAWSRASPTQKVFRFDRPGDLDRVPFDLFDVAPAYVVSQWIHGPDDAVYYCLAYCGKPGTITAAYTGRKLLQYPRQTGSTAICVGVVNGQVRELAEEVFRQSGFLGLGSLEIKYSTDGQPYITEPTVGRPNLQSHSAVAAGRNLQALAMQDALGLDTARFLEEPRNSWWVQEAAVRELLIERTPVPVPWRLILRELVRARRPAGAYWALQDPLPFLALTRETAERALGFLRRRRRP